MMWEQCTFDRFLVVAKFIAQAPLSLLNSCKLSFSIIGFKTSTPLVYAFSFLIEAILVLGDSVAGA
jgi:hypothetical protein